MIWHNLIVDGNFNGSHAFEREHEVRVEAIEHAVEVIEHEVRVTTDGNVLYVVLYQDRGTRCAFFKIRDRLWETNEQCLERLMLGIMLDVLFNLFEAIVL